MLCADVILGQNLKKKHKEVVFQIGGHQDKAIVGRDDWCGVTVSAIETPPNFCNMLATCQPIAAKSKKSIKTNFSSKKK